MSFPYRNIFQKTKNWKFDKSIKYNVGWVGIKPVGLWYEIENCFFSYPDITQGNYMYELKLDPECLYIISNFKELKKFQKKYSYIDFYSEEKTSKFYAIDWDKVSEDYCGFEIINFRKIRKEIKESYKYHKYRVISQYNWFYTFDGSSGCVWDLKAVNNISYVRKVSKKEEQRLVDIREKEEDLYDVNVIMKDVWAKDFN